MRNNMPCSQMDRVTLWENIEGEGHLYGVLHDKLLKPLKEKVNRPVCRGESHPAGFRPRQSREVASTLSLY